MNNDMIDQVLESKIRKSFDDWILEEYKYMAIIPRNDNYSYEAWKNRQLEIFKLESKVKELETSIEDLKESLHEAQCEASESRWKIRDE